METKDFNDLYKLKCNLNEIMKLENLIYFFAGQLSSLEYNNGIWKSKTIEHEDQVIWYFNLEGDKKWKLNSDNIHSETEISTSCLSVLSFTFALNYLMSEIVNDEKSEELFNEIVRLYYAIIGAIDLILDENEKLIFYKVID